MVLVSPGGGKTTRAVTAWPAVKLLGFRQDPVDHVDGGEAPRHHDSTLKKRWLGVHLRCRWLHNLWGSRQKAECPNDQQWCP